MNYAEAERQLIEILAAEHPLLAAWQADTMGRDPGAALRSLPRAKQFTPVPRALILAASRIIHELDDEDEANRLARWFLFQLVSPPGEAES